jgi:L,D-transpeptidase catalytic domain
VSGTRRARRPGAALIIAATALGLTTGAPAAAASDKREIERVSNERTRTVAAKVGRQAAIRSAPSVGARQTGQLQPFTFFGAREVVVVRAVTRDRLRRSWSLVRYSGLGWRRGWVLSSALYGRRVLNTQLVIDTGRLEARLYRDGKVVMRAPVGVGASSSPTPRGRYYIRERLVPPESGGIYGALAFGTSAFSRFRTDWPGGGQVGVHGTNQPGLIPGYISNGCVRLRDSDVLRLDDLMRVGTPLRII